MECASDHTKCTRESHQSSCSKRVCLVDMLSLNRVSSWLGFLVGAFSAPLFFFHGALLLPHKFHFSLNMLTYSFSISHVFSRPQGGTCTAASHSAG